VAPRRRRGSRRPCGGSSLWDRLTDRVARPGETLSSVECAQRRRVRSAGVSMPRVPDVRRARRCAQSSPYWARQDRSVRFPLLPRPSRYPRVPDQPPFVPVPVKLSTQHGSTLCCAVLCRRARKEPRCRLRCRVQQRAGDDAHAGAYCGHGIQSGECHSGVLEGSAAGQSLQSQGWRVLGLSIGPVHGTRSV
jgi:hypothetical protein